MPCHVVGCRLYQAVTSGLVFVQVDDIAQDKPGSAAEILNICLTLNL